MLRMLGIPTWFLTLSAADLHWPEMIQAVAVPVGKKLTQKDVQQMSIKRQKHILMPESHNRCTRVPTQT